MADDRARKLKNLKRTLKRHDAKAAQPSKRCGECGKVIRNRVPQAKYCLDCPDRERRRRERAARDPAYRDRQNERFRRYYREKVAGRWKNDEEFRARRAEINRVYRARKKAEREAAPAESG